jgi:DNA-binding MarR family transcriptional regulator
MMAAAAKRAPSAGKQRFAPLPLRALCDQRLGGLHLRTLGIVAAFDRLGKNGSGCWASQNTLAKIAGVDKSRLSRSLSDLREFGYLSSELNPHKRWFRVHRVIYSDEDAHFWGDKSVAPHDNCFDASVVKSEPISCTPEKNQLQRPSENNNENNDQKRRL